MTTEASRTIINWAMAITASAQYRFGSRLLSWGAAVVSWSMDTELSFSSEMTFAPETGCNFR